MSNYKYYAFISYRHTDIKAAKRLQSLLEHYNLPTSIQRQKPDAPKRFKIFRDTDELTSGVLSEELQKKLRESKYLIVFCSPDSAQSKYVGDEIAYFRKLGKEKDIIPFIINGIPNDSNCNCFHPALTLNGLDLLGIDVQSEQGFNESAKFHKAFIRLVARMLDLDFDVLWNRRKRYYAKLWTSFLAAFIIVIGIIIFLINNAQPFDSTISLREVGAHSNLPLHSKGEDSISVFIPNGKSVEPIHSLKGPIKISNIPGKYKNEKVRIICKAYGFNTLDTFVNLDDKISLSINRNPKTYGRVYYKLQDEDGLAIPNATVDFGFLKAKTSPTGVIDVTIPLKYQNANGYAAKISFVRNGKIYNYKTRLDGFQNRSKIMVQYMDPAERIR